MPVVSVACPHCGASVAVDCSYSGGSSTDHSTCLRCGRLVKVRYSNDSFGFRIQYVN